MYCTKCGKEIEKGASFCGYCGTPWKENSVGDEGAPPERQQPAGREEAVKIKSKKRLNLLPFVIIGIVTTVLLVIVVTGIAVLGSPARRYDRQLSLGKKYLDELDYEKAIAAYKAAIEIDPKNPEAYGALAELYLATGDTEAALAILQEGYAATESKELEILISEVGNNAAAGGDSIPADTHSATVTVLGANETGAISGATVTVKGGDGEYEAETDSNGKVTFNDLSDGNYSIECKAEGYYDCTQEFTLSGAESEPVVAMVPEVSGDDAYVVVRWNGDHDLDLCAFNTDMKEYVNIGHPIDSAGNVFLYADHGADMPFETIYLHNISAELVKSFFITEAKNAREGSPSGMEADGVTISVYNSTGLIYTSTADPEKNAALWCPCYCYAGQIYDQQDYIDDASGEQYAWISFDEKDAYTAVADADAAVSADEWKAAYLELISGAHTDSCIDDWNAAKYCLAYIDDDDIPELVVYGDYCFDEVYEYSAGDVRKVLEHGYGTWGRGPFQYYERTGYAHEWSYYYPVEYTASDGRIYGDAYGSHVTTFEDDLTPVNIEGNTYYSSEAQLDMDNYEYLDESVILDEDYYRNGAAISKTEYERETDKITSHDLKGDENACSKSDMIALLASSSSSAGSGWEQAYLDIVINDPDGLNEDVEWIKYGLLYINDDDMPELVVCWGDMDQFTQERCTIYSYEDGRISEKTIRYGSGEPMWVKAYYEKKDYLYIERCYENIDDESYGYEYCPVFRHQSPVYEKWDYNYPTGYHDTAPDYENWVTYTAWTKDGGDINEWEYNSAVSALGSQKRIKDECMSFSEIVQLLRE